MKMTAEKSAPKKGKRKMKRVTIEKVGNGYQVSHHPEPTMKRHAGGMMMPDYAEKPPEDMVFSGGKTGGMKMAHKLAMAHASQQMAPDEEEGESGAPPQAMPGQAA